MSRWRRLVHSLLLLLIAGLPAMPAAAEGLYLKLAAKPAEVGPDQALTLRLTAVATHTFTLPTTPVFLVDDGSGERESSDLVSAAAGEASYRVTADRAVERSYSLLVRQPGTYRIRVQYRLANRVIQSNKVTVRVRAGQAAAQ